MSSSQDVTLGSVLRSRGVVLDGGLATLLESRGHDLASSLWSARMLSDDPDALLRAHVAFYAAGAEVATTASYQASYEGFAAVGVDRSGTEALLRRSCEVAGAARRARAEQEAIVRAPATIGGRVGGQRPRWVAASVGPYGAVLADGSEYRGDYGLTVQELRRWHRPRLQVLMQAVTDGLADVLAIETIPSSAEAEAVLAEIAGTGVPAWLSYTCAEGRTRTGEPAEDAFGLARGLDEIIAVGVNCCRSDEAADLVASAVEVSGLPGVVYPNSGEGWDPVARLWTGEPTFEPEMLAHWGAAGAGLIGGCCRVSPAQITSVAHLLAASGTVAQGGPGRRGGQVTKP